FSAAGVGMVLGLVQYKAGAGLLGRAGLLDEDTSSARFRRKNRNFYLIVAAAVLLMLVFGYLVNQGVFPLSMQQIAAGLGYGILILVLFYFIFLFVAGGHSPIEKKRLGVIFWLFILAAIFWSGFEQAGSSLNLFADQSTDRVIAGWEVPASWLQSVNPIFIILLAPVFGWLWTWLAARNANPSIPVKFALGLLGLAAGFFVISWGAANAGPGNLASPAWLVVTYFLHTCGELCLSPVGLSSITKLAPKGRVGQMMGIWFVGAALGNLFAGLLSGQLEELSSDALFGKVALFIGAAGVIALLASPFVRKLMGDVK
ncbi:MAG TPA: oligopeptide:H+ symporter, partial [Anseongella sp.]|nr:oligopeptide:H+ symporter [Anseongella sp.]